MKSLSRSRSLRGNTSPLPVEPPGREREPFFLGPFRQHRNIYFPSTPSRNRSRMSGENVPPDNNQTAATVAYVKANTPTPDGSPAHPKSTKKGRKVSAVSLPPLPGSPASLPRHPSAKPSPVGPKIESGIGQGQDNLATARRKLHWDGSGSAMSDTEGLAVEAGSTCSDSGVKVILRMRPLNDKEEQEVASRIVQKISSDAISLGDQRFTYDAIADEGTSQQDVFEMVGLPMVENCLSGFNSSIFAYGQTGSGKTHTMMGIATDPNTKSRSSDRRGLTPRVIERLFSRMQEEENLHVDKGLRYQCRCSFLEIYNEQITDLLEPTQRNLQIREDTKTGVYVDSLTEEFVSNVDDVISLLLKGLTNRRTGATMMNNESSRSHSVFTCVIESLFKNLAEGGHSVRTSRMNLVDLAGSERQKQSGVVGQRLKEAGNINKSLSQLGHVINILAEVAQTGKQRHIPYRDSRLTFLLQESLGGNAKLAMICAISPASRSETLSTLRFAQRAKVIQNKAVVNEEASNDVGLLRKQIRHLKDELMKMKANGSQESGARGYTNSWNARRSYNLLRLSMSHPMTLSAAELQEPDPEMEVGEDDRDEETAILQPVLGGGDIANQGFSRLPVINEKDLQFEKTCIISTSVSGVSDAADRYKLHNVDLTDSGYDSLSNNNNDCVNFGMEIPLSPEITTTPQVMTIPELIALHSPPRSVSPRLKGTSKRDLSGSPVALRRVVNLPSATSVCEEIYHSTQERFDGVANTSRSFQLNTCATRHSCIRTSMNTARPTEKLAACLQRGLKILDSHQRNSRGSVRWPTAGLQSIDLHLPRMVDKFDKGVQTAAVVVTASTSAVAQVAAKPAGGAPSSHNLVLTLADDSLPAEPFSSTSAPNFLFQDPHECHFQLTPCTETVGEILHDAGKIRLSATTDSLTGVFEELNKRSGSNNYSFRHSTVPREKVLQSDASVEEPDTGHPQLSSYANLINVPGQHSLGDTIHHKPTGSSKKCDPSNWQLVALDSPKCSVVQATDGSSPKVHLVQEVVEALLTGAIRRERVAEEAMNKQAAEVEQLNRLVRQYKHERECNAILHQSREGKIARLESLMDNVISTDAYLDEEWSALLLEHKMLQEKFDNHPEVTQSNVEQQRLLDELSHYREFFDLGEREILLDEVELLRNQVQLLLEHYRSNPSSITRQQTLSLARISVQASKFGEASAEPTNPSCFTSLSFPLEGPLGKPSSGLSMVVTEAANHQERLQDEKVQAVSSRKYGKADRGEMERDWEEREREWMAVLEEWREEAESYKLRAERRKQELDCEKRCSDEMQDALRMAMTGHARLLEQYAELQEKHIVSLAKHRKIKEGTADVRKMAKKAGVTSLESRWLDAQALQIVALKVEIEEERQRSKEEIKGLTAQLQDTGDAVQAAGELLVRLKEAEESVIIAQDAAAMAEQDAGALRRDMEKARRRHATELATLQQRVLESRLQTTAVCPMCVMAERVKFQFTDIDAETAQATFAVEALSTGPQQTWEHRHLRGSGCTTEEEDNAVQFSSHTLYVDEIDQFFNQN